MTPRPIPSRSAARLAAVQALYQQEMEGTPLPRLLHEFHEHRLGATIEDAPMPRPSTASSTTWSAGPMPGGRKSTPLIAARLAEGWSLERLDKPMKAILRVGAYELLARADVPVASVITEYVDVAHAFYDKRESGFVNGLLDAIAKAGACSARGLERAANPRRSQRLRRIATDPAARGLADDAALARRPGPDPRQDRRGRPFPALRSRRRASAGSWSPSICATSPPRARRRPPPCCADALSGDGEWD